MSYKDLLKQFPKDDHLRCILQWMKPVLDEYLSSKTAQLHSRLDVEFGYTYRYTPTSDLMFRSFVEELGPQVRLLMEQQGFSVHRLSEIIAWEDLRVRSTDDQELTLGHHQHDVQFLMRPSVSGHSLLGIHTGGKNSLKSLAWGTVICLLWDILHQSILREYLAEVTERGSSLEVLRNRDSPWVKLRDDMYAPVMLDAA